MILNRFNLCVMNWFMSALKNLKLQKKLNTKTEEAKKKGEDIGRRKKDSGLKTKSKSSGEEHLYVPGQDLDDIIEKAKANIPK